MSRLQTDQRSRIEQWFQANGFEEAAFEKFLNENGKRCITYLQCIDLFASSSGNEFTNSIDGNEEWRQKTYTLSHDAFKVKDKLILDHFFETVDKFSAREIEFVVNEFNVNGLLDLWTITHDHESAFVRNSLLTRAKLVKLLPQTKEEISPLNEELWQSVLRKDSKPWSLSRRLWISLVFSLVVAFVVSIIDLKIEDTSDISKYGLFNFLTGSYLSPDKCKVHFEWNEPQYVGSSVSFIIEFYHRNGKKFHIQSKEHFLIEIIHGTHKIACSVEFAESINNPETINKVKAQFTARRAGDYQIHIMVGTMGLAPIRGSPFVKNFLPSAPDPQQIGFIHHCSTVVCTEKVPYHLFIEPKDKYGNLCIISDSFDPSDDYGVDIVELSTGRPISSAFYWEVHPHASRIILVLKLETEGLYKGCVYYRGANIKNGDFYIVVLSTSQTNLVETNIKKSRNINFEVKLLTFNNERIIKPKKVFLCVSPKLLSIKEYILKIIPKRVATFRLCPSTKFYFVPNEKLTKSTTDLSKFQAPQENLLIIDDGCQPQVELFCEDRNVIVATYTHFLLKNIGGSETFRDKQDFFYYEVRKFHQKHFHERLTLKINRERILESSLKATKGFSVADWCKNFEISFVDEEGVDWGGVRKEWFEILCNHLFDPKYSELFYRFKNDKQGLVHPNPKRPSHMKLKYYEFAGKIVGKCLYESALGSSYRQLVKARFTRSFLAQLIGLRVHYKYFEQDDPDLYVSKIKYIIENDVSAMELMFAEEEYDNKGQLIRVIDLIPGGSKIEVTNENKMYYLDALAQHKLANCVKEEVEHFLKGLNDLIPDNLLAIFDENELELLMCGTGQFSITELKANHTVSGVNEEFLKVLDWFWNAISNFTEEEMARLLQFTTGCSQLPPGGFAELNPQFHITSSPAFGILPTAHTCFNQICLPEYDSYEQFERALRLAINEGNEGFGIV
ncbi:apoptosis-resistant E3 ubiquitin protein ligase 1-like protein [Dinothrombium tinctorium]|uniref:HECT-type E3 ubiquitin transferase n=1 Tax=Dinothrombium tinctorium TaxID=1965070 RepID=A0A3S3S8A7_9ACAR|nr:apoptosis-resistant E3 ubiquitin protein ligase 1-like protein [Dinothrombium tinctorium]